MAILPFLITGFNGAGVKRAQNDVVRDLASLKDAINSANENVETTILVDSFEVSNATMMDAMRNLNINGKTIVIKGVGENTTITTMDQGSFYIVGEKGKVNNVTFENITFKQNIDKSKTISLPNNAISLSKNSYDTNLSIKNCKFVDWTGVKNTGGAIQVAFSNVEEHSLNVNVSGCSFYNCTSALGGGAISIDGALNVSLNVSESIFESNSSKNGGALKLQGVKTTIEGCVFKNNSADKGGALAIGNSKSFISNNVFESNSTLEDDGNSILIENSRLNTNTFINNSFYNSVENDSSELKFNVSSGNLDEIKSKVYFNTFYNDKDSNISHEAYKDHVDEFASLYVSNHYDSLTINAAKCAYTGDKEAVRRINDKYYLTSNSELKLDRDDYIDRLKSFYLEAYGDFYIGNNLSDSIRVRYGKNENTYLFGEEFLLEKERFGFDLIDNVVDGVSFVKENALISSNGVLNIKPVYKMNGKGVGVYVITPIGVVALGCLAALLLKLHKKRDVKASGEQNFDMDRWIDQSVSSKALESLTEKEKEVVGYILKGTPRKEIADKLFISESTVKNHVTKIYAKLNIKNRAELIEMLNK